MKKNLLSHIGEKTIWKLINLFSYCSVPPILLVVTITIMYELVNSMKGINNAIIVFFQQSMPIFLCYAIIPLLFFKIQNNVSFQEIGLKRSENPLINYFNILIIMVFIGYLVTKHIFESEMSIWVIHYAFVAISEEILVRGIILFELKELMKKKWMAILASAVIFSLVFHSTDGIWINMAYRIPFGLVMAILYEKTNSLMTSMLFHWMYDVLLSI